MSSDRIMFQLGNTSVPEALLVPYIAANPQDFSGVIRAIKQAMQDQCSAAEPRAWAGKIIGDVTLACTLGQEKVEEIVGRALCHGHELAPDIAKSFMNMRDVECTAVGSWRSGKIGGDLIRQCLLAICRVAPEQAPAVGQVIGARVESAGDLGILLYLIETIRQTQGEPLTQQVAADAVEAMAKVKEPRTRLILTFQLWLGTTYPQLFPPKKPG